ncbi:MAG: DUF1631 domain-containing protein [Rhodanobacteraceae bacterium]|nr:DUF1631 domain-containing protein [Rhodanobacteraceae bacterium]
MNAVPRPEQETLSFAQLGQSTAPPRVRELLDGTWRAAWPLIGAALQRGLDELQSDLFGHAERAPNVNAQNHCFDALREVRQKQAEFIERSCDGMQRSLLHLIDKSVALDQLNPGESNDGRRSELSLVDPVRFEEILVLTQIGTRAEMRAAEELHALAYRQAVIAGGAPAESETLALGPQSLCGALHVASHCFDISTAHRTALYRRIDKQLFAQGVGLYEALNRQLANAGVLPHLRLVPRRGTPRRTAAPEASPGAAAAPAAVEVPPAQPIAPAGPVASGGAPASVPQPAQPAHPTAQPASVAAAPALAPAPARPALRGEGPAMQAFRRLVGAAAPEAPATAAGEEQPSAPEIAPAHPVLERVDFDSLRRLMAARRPAQDLAIEGAHTPSTADLDAVLSQLAARPAPATQRDGRLVHRSVADVKRDLLAHLRGRGDNAPARLRQEDSDAIDLVGHLFDALRADQRPTSPTHGLLTQMQVPLLKVALRDKAFFSERAHPARRLLEALLQTSETWIDDDSQDRALLEKLGWLTERVAHDYDGDATVFARLNEDLDKHVGGLRRKAEVAERHQVEAAKGRERLQMARATAAENVQQRLATATPPEAVRTLLESAWVDVLALSFLRLGYEHPRTRDRLEFIERLIDLFGFGRPLAERRFELQKLHEEFEEGLASIGYHDNAIERAWRDIARLVDDPEEAAAEAAVATVRELVEQRPRLGGDRREASPAGDAAGDAAARPAPPLPVGPRELEMIERIRHLPFGTWFEFTLNQQGDTARRKLCWFSTVTGRCLFVNVRGQKAQERSLEELARDLVRGNAKVVEEAKEGLIDRAWKGIVSMLRGVGLTPREAT